MSNRDDHADHEPPQPVEQITTAKVTADRLGLSWAAAHDNVRVVGYHIWLNGFEVASTAQTHVSVPWFNDDTTTHVVRVLAVDAAGNESETSPSVLVTRPDPEPEPEPSQPTPQPTTPSPDPAPSPGPTSASPTAESSRAPGTAAEPTDEPTGASNGTP